MKKEALRILNKFAERGLEEGDLLPYLDFEEALVIEEGFVRDEAVREALESLIREGYVSPATSGLVLTARGEDFIRRRAEIREETPVDVLISASLASRDKPAPAPSPRDQPAPASSRSLRDLAAALSIKASALQQILLGKSDEEIQALLKEPDGRARLEREVADVLMYALSICDRVGIDPLVALRSML